MSQFLLISAGGAAIVVLAVALIIWAHTHGKNVANAEANMEAVVTEVRHDAQMAQATTLAHMHSAIADVKTKVDALHAAVVTSTPVKPVGPVAPGTSADSVASKPSA